MEEDKVIDYLVHELRLKKVGREIREDRELRKANIQKPQKEGKIIYLPKKQG